MKDVCNETPFMMGKLSASLQHWAQGPAVQSIISLTSSLRGQLIKSYMTLLPNTMIFFVEK